MNRTAKLVALGLALISMPAQAEEGMSRKQHDGHHKHDIKTSHESHSKSDAAAKSEAAAAFAQVNDKMHKDMSIAFTGDADVDFMKSMIPHHQGAIDMARVLLKYEKDPETRKLAQDIIAAQEKEIAFMKEWLAKRAK